MDIDLILLSRDLSAPRWDVGRGIETQDGMRFQIHRVIGAPRPDDPNRWETIARARNEGKGLGRTPFVMYLDDDVVLGPGCMARLLMGLRRRPEFAALAADYNGEMNSGWENWDYPRHVGMGATLFRRERLAVMTFRWESGRCECQCCCDDLRRGGFAVGYLPGAVASHRQSTPKCGPCPTASVADAITPEGRAALETPAQSRPRSRRVRSTPLPPFSTQVPRVLPRLGQR